MRDLSARNKKMNAIRITLVLAFGVLLITDGCTLLGKPDPDPLEGWKRTGSALRGNPYAKAIFDDYIMYVQSLSAKERKYVDAYNTWFYENGTGQHAIKIALAYDSTFWDHILIYDSNNRRIRTIKRFGGHYRS